MAAATDNKPAIKPRFQRQEMRHMLLAESFPQAGGVLVKPRGLHGCGDAQPRAFLPILVALEICVRYKKPALADVVLELDALVNVDNGVHGGVACAFGR